MVLTFLFVLIGWVFFRAAGIQQALAYLKYTVQHALLHPGIGLHWITEPISILIGAMMLVEWSARREAHALAQLPASVVLRWAIYLLIVITILLYMDVQTTHEFIYFQF